SYVDGHDGDVKQLTQKETDHVVDVCYQCRLCYGKCPYTQAENHPFNLDFPRLMLRHKAVKTKKKGEGWRNRLLTDPDLLGRMGGLSAGPANFFNRLAPVRWIVEKVLGVHRHKRLPLFYRQTFAAWFKKNRGRFQVAAPQGKVVIFPTCFVNYNQPGIGKAAVEVFTKNGYQVEVAYKHCCGMPALDGGNIPRARAMAQKNNRFLLPFVRRGYQVVALNPTCSLMMRREYPELLGEEGHELAAQVFDAAEFLNKARKAGLLAGEVSQPPGEVVYHASCHLRAQNVGLPGRDLIRAAGGSVTPVTECSGHDGTWAMKREYFALSLTAGEKAFSGVKAAPRAVVVSDCPLAAIQIEQATGRRVVHTMEVLAQAYQKTSVQKP
ncbi:MAG: heterodisulfide reductase-related iron-sulfur binding cluster, partial [Deltaproteobacteria bacterium]|nr:heterodisulfide reductase-related iron-sulfur binding cluster [Deltaproteobacteria bacterium]